MDLTNGIKEKGNPAGKSCGGGRLEPGQSFCNKRNNPHKLNWEHYVCDHCNNVFSIEEEPLWFENCPSCGMDLHGGTVNHYG
eukprot:gene35647-47932_t